jgi:hypothetical protein
VSTLKQHAQSIATTAGDYRKDELEPFATAHVMTWAEQFDDEDRLPVLAELDHVLKRTYFSEKAVTNFLERLTKNAKLVGGDPAKFWQGAGVLDIQQGGNSQSEMLKRFDAALQRQIGIRVNDCEGSSGTFIYLDDAIFTGNRVRYDLAPWIQNDAPKNAKLQIVVSALHIGGSYYAEQQINKASREAEKSIRTTIWRVREIENRLSYKNASEVLWPASFPKTTKNFPRISRCLPMRATRLRNEAKVLHPRTAFFLARLAARQLNKHSLKPVSASVRCVPICPTTHAHWVFQN